MNSAHGAPMSVVAVIIPQRAVCTPKRSWFPRIEIERNFPHAQNFAGTGAWDEAAAAAATEGAGGEGDVTHHSPAPTHPAGVRAGVG